MWDVYRVQGASQLCMSVRLVAVPRKRSRHCGFHTTENGKRDVHESYSLALSLSLSLPRSLLFFVACVSCSNTREKGTTGRVDLGGDGGGGVPPQGDAGHDFAEAREEQLGQARHEGETVPYLFAARIDPKKHVSLPVLEIVSSRTIS